VPSSPDDRRDDAEGDGHCGDHHDPTRLGDQLQVPAEQDVGPRRPGQVPVGQVDDARGPLAGRLSAPGRVRPGNPGTAARRAAATPGRGVPADDAAGKPGSAGIIAALNHRCFSFRADGVMDLAVSMTRKGAAGVRSAWALPPSAWGFVHPVLRHYCAQRSETSGGERICRKCHSHSPVRGECCCEHDHRLPHPGGRAGSGRPT
jgi:hypothetical protein